MKPENDLDKQTTETGEPGHVFASYELTRERRGSMTPRQRNLLIIFSSLALLVILVIGVVVWRRRAAAPADEATTPVVSVKVAKAEKDAIATQIVAGGTSFPRGKTHVGVQSNTPINKIAR